MTGLPRWRPRWYVLDGRETVPVSDMMLAGRRFEIDDRQVARTELPGGIEVSTVFLGLDHAWGDGPPMLFETMVFIAGEGDRCWRCSTFDEAEAQHVAVVKELTKA